MKVTYLSLPGCPEALWKSRVRHRIWYISKPRLAKGERCHKRWLLLEFLQRFCTNCTGTTQPLPLLLCWFTPIHFTIKLPQYQQFSGQSPAISSNREILLKEPSPMWYFPAFLLWTCPSRMLFLHFSNILSPSACWQISCFWYIQKKKKVLLIDFEPFLLRMVFGQLYYGFTFHLPDGLLSFLQSPFGLHLLKGVFYTSNNLFSLLLAILAFLLVPDSLRIQECWNSLQTLSLKRKSMQLLLKRPELLFIFL